jgi:hypothetical protein
MKHAMDYAKLPGSQRKGFQTLYRLSTLIQHKKCLPNSSPEKSDGRSHLITVQKVKHFQYDFSW